MTIEITIQRMLLIVMESGGTYRPLVFNDMPEERARQLAREYGHPSDRIRSIEKVAIRYRRKLDNSEVREILDRLPFQEWYSHETMLAAVRCIVPQATRIIRL